MKKHIITPFGMGVRAMALLAMCAAVSCTDDYTLDDEKPAWLGESVLVELQQRGNFKNYLNLMHDLGMDEILSRTGSRTVFAAPDAAFDTFYKNNATLPENNPWHNATSYDKLSRSQKLLLAKCSMLNNAITMETLSSSEANGAGEVTRGAYMRRNTLVSVTDTIERVNSNQLPYSYNEPDEDGNLDQDFWGFYRSDSYEHGNGTNLDDGTGRGVYLTSGDGTQNMMLCFTTEHMASTAMVSSDLELVLGEHRLPTDVHVYDAKIQEQDITCQNGYVELMGKVIAPLPNMAEVIRTNGETNIFSHILERFSLPVYVKEYNDAYRNLHNNPEKPDYFPESDTIYSKWYMSPKGMHMYSRENNSLGRDLITQTDNRAVVTIGDNESYTAILPVMLKFDPAWNAIDANPNSDAKYSDMAAMFVPNDRTMLRELKQGGRLHMLVDTYAKKYLNEVAAATLDNPESLEGLYKAIDQIPMNSIGTFVSNIMFPTFTGSVQSKFGSLKNDASEDIFINGECSVEKVKLACNGAVYITDAVYPPADYSSVAAPAYISLDKKIMKWAIYDGDKTTTGMNPLMSPALNYYAYLKAMSSVFTLFLPDDEALQYYYDPTSFYTQVPRRLQFTYKKQGAGTPPVVTSSYRYNVDEGVSGNIIGSANSNSEADDQDIMTRLRDILESHTIVHNDASELMSTGGEKDEYYLTKGGTAVKVIRDENGTVTAVKGGFQLENEKRGIDPESAETGVLEVKVKNFVKNSIGGNGDTYILNAPIVPASKSVYAVTSEHEEGAFDAFLDLCLMHTSSSDLSSDDLPDGYCNVDMVIEKLGLTINEETGKTSAQLQRKYQIFADETKFPDMNVTFFNNYNYTVYAPDNEAMEQAYSDGLPSWEDVEQEYNDEENWNVEYETDEEGNEVLNDDGEKIVAGKTLKEDVRTRLIAKINYLINFIRLHFQDQSVFADRMAWSKPNEYASSCFYTDSGDETMGNFIKLRVHRAGNQKMTVQSLSMEDGSPVSKEINIVGEDGKDFNIMARDVALILNNTKTGPRAGLGSVKTMKNLVLEASSAAVVHRIDDVLLLPKSKDFKMIVTGNGEERFPDFNDPNTAEELARRFLIVNKTNPKL